MVLINFWRYPDPYQRFLIQIWIRIQNADLNFCKTYSRKWWMNSKLNQSELQARPTKLYSIMLGTNTCRPNGPQISGFGSPYWLLYYMVYQHSISSSYSQIISPVWTWRRAGLGGRCFLLKLIHTVQILKLLFYYFHSSMLSQLVLLYLCKYSLVFFIRTIIQFIEASFLLLKFVNVK